MIRIPFPDFLREPLKENRVKCFARTQIFGNSGDQFEAFGCFFIITDLIRRPLSEVFTNYWEQCGFNSEEHMRSDWKRIYWIAKRDESEDVWLHFIKKTA